VKVLEKILLIVVETIFVVHLSKTLKWDFLYKKETKSRNIFIMHIEISFWL